MLAEGLIPARFRRADAACFFSSCAICERGDVLLRRDDSVGRQVLKALDQFLGPWLIRALPSMNPCAEVPRPSSLLLIRPGGIGDAILLIPSIRALKRSFPDVQIHVLAERRNAQAFDLSSDVDRVFLYDCPSELFEILRLSYDVVIDTEQWYRLSAIVARLIRAPVKVGFSTNERRNLFSVPVRYSQQNYEARSFGDLVGALGCELPESEYRRNAWLRVPETAGASVESLLPKTELPLVVVFPGASVPERRWGTERFSELSKRLTISGTQVVLVGAGGEKEVASEIAEASGGVSLAGETSLAQTAAVLSRAACVVTADSSVLHLAAGLNVPTVSLFGPGRALKWAPVGSRHRVLRRELPCSPCTTYGRMTPCRRNVECMQQISVDDVFEAVQQILEHDRGAAP